MQLKRDMVSEILTGLEYGPFEADADEDNWAKGDEDFQEMVNTVAKLANEHGPYMVVALAEYIEDYAHDHVTADEIEEYVERHYRWSGRSKGALLQSYAQNNEFDLGRLWNALDESGGMDYFDWEGFTRSGSSWVNDMHFIEVSTTGNADSVYLFEER